MSEFIQVIIPPVVTVVNPEGESFTLNEYEFLHLRVKIMRDKANGWSWTSQTQTCEIDSNGRMSAYPPQFDLYENYITELAFPEHGKRGVGEIQINPKTIGIDVDSNSWYRNNFR